ncbi:hypothetical protein HNQ36_003666 [Afipia massiliensis]|uniref:Uncharacterized protein n=1 Tax=Afipia massiliensis TaxID=211460 RepID=A0A840NAD6_9BRAD|nr:hypothetical protein [Afipia massiliensis]
MNVQVLGRDQAPAINAQFNTLPHSATALRAVRLIHARHVFVRPLMFREIVIETAAIDIATNTTVIAICA